MVWAIDQLKKKKHNPFSNDHGEGIIILKTNNIKKVINAQKYWGTRCAWNFEF